MSVHVERAWLLYSRSRYDDALKELGFAFAEDPNGSTSHALAALCQADADRLDEAETHARTSVGSDPESSLPHYALGYVLMKRRHYPQALDAAGLAIRADAWDPSNYALAAQILLFQDRYADALKGAEAGLEIDSENVACQNIRAHALVGLGRKEEARETLDAALQRDPEDAVTHTSQGWALLNQSKPKEAQTHFAEALRLDPENDVARSGMVEALKAKNPVYRVLLRWFLWMGRMSSGARWGLIIGLYVMYRITRGVLASNPDWAPFVMPLQIAYLGFVVITWVADPFFNLLLMFDEYGRAALSRDQKFAAVAVGSALGVCVLTVIGTVAGVIPSAVGLGLGIATLFLALPLNASFAAPEGWPRTAARVIAGGMLLGIIGSGVLRAAGETLAAGLLFLVVVLVGALFTWFGNLLYSAKPRR